MFRHFIFIVLIVISNVTFSYAKRIEVTDIKVEMINNPLGISNTSPRFSWKIKSSERDVLQRYYKIEVAKSIRDLKNSRNLAWESGEVKSDKSVLIPFSGDKLESATCYYWRVRVYTNRGNSGWSKPSKWTMTLLDKNDLIAKWIGIDKCCNENETIGSEKSNKSRLAARYLRREFSIDKKVKRAIIYSCGIGSSEIYINGKKISNDVLSPTVSLYNVRAYYNEYDVTKFLTKRNTLGVILGNGRFFAMRNPGIKGFGFPRLFAQLIIDYDDGEKKCIITDENWKATSKGPIIANNEFDGEEYDEHLEMKGWDKNGFDDSKWQNADIMIQPCKYLDVQPNPNIIVHENLSPKSITQLADGKYIVDMGQNMVGWLKVRLKNKKDSTVTMRFAELLEKDGNLYTKNLRSAAATDKYTSSKDGYFTWEPKFTYHGFRFVEISGIDYKPSLSDITGRVVYDKMNLSGKFETSNDIINGVYKNAYWGIRGNYRGMPTDCPQRDERLGWLGDRTTGAYGEAYIFNNSLFYDKWLQDIEDSMSPQGCISSVSPSYWTVHINNVTWPAAFFNVADMLNKQYGDISAITKHYSAMKRFIYYIKSTMSNDNLVVNDQWGDWCVPPESLELIHSKDPKRITDGTVLSTTLFYYLLNKMKEFAAISGHREDIPGYDSLANIIKIAYNQRFYNKEKGYYSNNTITSNLLSLQLGLSDKADESKIIDNIIDKTVNSYDSHVSAGVMGIQHLMRGLTEHGNVNLAYKIATNNTYPSWGYMLKQGATTIWELWNGNTADPSMNSCNHVMLLGDLIIWYYEDLAGIKCSENSTAFKHITMKPYFPEGLTFVDASYNSVYGLIKSHWDKNGSKFSWDIEIPANTQATVIIPASFNINLKKMNYIHSVKTEGDNTVIEIGSGKYSFEN